MGVAKLNQANMQAELNVGTQVIMSPHLGKVLSPQQFIIDHLELLSDYEQSLIRNGVNVLPNDVGSLPFDRPLAVARHRSLAESSATLHFQAQCVTETGVLLKQHGLYIKECRPTANRDEWLSAIRLDIFSNEFKLEQRPFGVMDTESVMRELLGYLVYLDNDWPTARRPVAVLQYEYSGYQGFGLVFEVNPAFSQCQPLEDGFAFTEYLNGKAKLLAQAHANGVFRGYVNHVGNSNDMVNLDAQQLTLVDFEHLQCVDMSQLKPNLRIGVLTSGFIEAIRSVLFNSTFYWLSDNKQLDSAINIDANQCEFLRYYLDALLTQVDQLGGDYNEVLKAYHNAMEHSLFRDNLADNVIQSLGQVESLN